MTLTQPNFQIEIKENEKFSPISGAVLIHSLFEKFHLREMIDKTIGLREDNGLKKYTDSSYIESLVIMQALGGGTVDDLRLIREDPVLSGIIGGIPAKTSTHNYMAGFVSEEEEEKRGQGRAFVPEPNEHLKGFEELTRHLLNHSPHVKDFTEITLDQDATFIPSEVNKTLFNYKSERSFEAFNTYCPEYDMVIKSEYRDGNVPPSYRQLENLTSSLDLLPDTVKRVRLRSDTAGYQINLLKYCAEGKDERFGVIEFAISAPVNKVLKSAAERVPESEWRPIPDTTQECAEVVYVPNSLGHSKKGPEYRFIVTREEIHDTDSPDLRQHLLFNDEETGDSPISALHPTIMGGKVYKVFALVTNLSWSAEEVVLWQRKRCGKSEELHSVLKNNLAGGHVVASALGVNAAWWQITTLTYNILTMIKRLCLAEEYRNSHPKRLRYWLFSVVGRIGNHARKIVVTIYDSMRFGLFRTAWNKLEALQVYQE